MTINDYVYIWKESPDKPCSCFYALRRDCLFSTRQSVQTSLAKFKSTPLREIEHFWPCLWQGAHQKNSRGLIICLIGVACSKLSPEGLRKACSPANSHRSKPWICDPGGHTLPVVPRKAVAEVSKIGNL